MEGILKEQTYIEWMNLSMELPAILITEILFLFNKKNVAFTKIFYYK